MATVNDEVRISAGLNLILEAKEDKEDGKGKKFRLHGHSVAFVLLLHESIFRNDNKTVHGGRGISKLFSHVKRIADIPLSFPVSSPQGHPFSALTGLVESLFSAPTSPTPMTITALFALTLARPRTSPFRKLLRLPQADG
jgi:hypothetical protein